MESAQLSPLRFSGEFRHGVDEKRRIQIPAKWRPKEGEVEFAFMVWRQYSEGVCVLALPPQQFEQLVQKIENLSHDRMRVRRALGKDTAILTVDKSGRVCLPETMTEAAGIKGGDVVLVGLLDRFEIWSPDRYQQTAASDAAALAKTLEDLG